MHIDTANIRGEQLLWERDMLESKWGKKLKIGNNTTMGA